MAVLSGLPVSQVDDRTTDGGGILPEGSCPSCGFIFDAATSLEKPEARPQPGDVSVCIRCATVTEFAADFSLRKVSHDEFQSLPIDIQNILYKTIISIRTVNSKRKR